MRRWGIPADRGHGPGLLSFGMSDRELAERVVQRMFENDPYSQWLGIERRSVMPGSCVLRMRVREEMGNGFGIAHGGITYALSDSALAFAANSHGVQAVSIETSITHTRPAKREDTLVATAAELNRSERFATYHVTVMNQDGKTVSLFKGTVFRTGEPWKV